MSSIPYSRYLIYPVPWYSFLIVVGAVSAIILACREERRRNFPKDTVIDLALWILPCGIIGARLYYVAFSWNQFSADLFSVFRVWEGGLAIYGGVIAGFVVLLIFSKKRNLSPLVLCDLIAPGLALAQCIGRWGNWFNQEAYGLPVTDQALCFFPFAVQIPSDGYTWHLATFFYESIWDLAVFLFLMLSRHRLLRKQGDVFFFYLFLYASGRMVIEELRMDSLYASSIRISQLLSILLCLGILIYYLFHCGKIASLSLLVRFLLLPFALSGSVLILADSFLGIFGSWSSAGRAAFLLSYALLMLTTLFVVFFREVKNADNKS